jgi:hypothetical protein
LAAFSDGVLVEYLDHVERFLKRSIARNLEIERATAAETNSRLDTSSLALLIVQPVRKNQVSQIPRGLDCLGCPGQSGGSCMNFIEFSPP